MSPRAVFQSIGKAYRFWPSWVSREIAREENVVVVLVVSLRLSEVGGGGVTTWEVVWLIYLT